MAVTISNPLTIIKTDLSNVYTKDETNQLIQETSVNIENNVEQKINDATKIVIYGDDEEV